MKFKTKPLQVKHSALDYVFATLKCSTLLKCHNFPYLRTVQLPNLFDPCLSTNPLVRKKANSLSIVL